MLEPIIDSPIILTLTCGLLAALLVSVAFMSPYMSRFAMPAAAPGRFPLRSFTRAALVAFILLVNAASLGLAHRLPLGSTLIAAGFLILAFLPADEPIEEPGAGL